ncbi:MAG TPA: LysR family transcriptional regulator [Polyangiaceae bacterium]|nr:LysR family transcriptional regulator [Polyangiaceae bacterium]
MNVDPGALVALNVLLEERSVTRAARRLGITQSSMSHRLARLREALGDGLFVRVGATLTPTPRALAIAEPLADALRALNAAVAIPLAFDPGRANGRASIVMPDLLAPFAPDLVARISAQAPGLALRFASVSGELSTALAGPELSLALVPARFAAADMQSRAVGELRFGVAGRRGHPALARRLSLERWLAERHVVVSVGLDRSNVIDDELNRRGLERRVGLVVPSFLAGLFSLAQSNLLMNVPMPLVDEAAKQLGLCVRDAPLPLPRLHFSMVWHPRFQHDAAHLWLRQQVLELVQHAFRKQPRADSNTKSRSRVERTTSRSNGGT